MLWVSVSTEIGRRVTGVAILVLFMTDEALLTVAREKMPGLFIFILWLKYVS